MTNTDLHRIGAEPQKNEVKENPCQSFPSLRIGDCYDAALRAVLEIPGAVLCHGTVSGTGKLKGVDYGHAWVEIDDIVFDFANGKRIGARKEKYYAAGKCREVFRYPFQDAAKLALGTKHCGPWNAHEHRRFLG